MLINRKAFGGNKNDIWPGIFQQRVNLHRRQSPVQVFGNRADLRAGKHQLYKRDAVGSDNCHIIPNGYAQSGQQVRRFADTPMELPICHRPGSMLNRNVIGIFSCAVDQKIIDRHTVTAFLFAFG